MKVAVSGAAGFIGRHVLAELAKRPVDVVAIVRNSSQRTGIGSSVQCVELDTAVPPPDAFSAIGRPDALIHLAWSGLPNYRSLHHIECELPKQYGFLAGLIQAGLSTLLVTGTCLEYGMQFGPLAETLDTRPNNPYGLAKDALRRQLECLHGHHPFALTWARLFYLHGEGQSQSSLLPQLKQAVERGESSFNMSAGEQLRDYLPVDEAARFLVALALKRGNHGVVNVCCGEPISVRRLVEDCIEKNNWSIELNLGQYPYPDYEPLAFWGNADKLKAILREN